MAQQFLAFVEAYMFESGAGNGHSAYWQHGHEEPVEGDAETDDIAHLNSAVIATMADMISVARLATGKRDELALRGYVPSVGVQKSSIVFACDMEQFPSRIRPEEGDFARIVIDHEGLQGVVGWVIESSEDTLVMCLGTDRKKRVAQKDKITVPAANAMKIHHFAA